MGALHIYCGNMARDKLLILLLKNQQVWANKGEIANENKQKNC